MELAGNRLKSQNLEAHHREMNGTVSFTKNTNRHKGMGKKRRPAINQPIKPSTQLEMWKCSLGVKDSIEANDSEKTLCK